MFDLKTNKDLVSVCMITYNHEHFIRQAIESVLMQQVFFSIELVIGEDGSTDDTWSICLEYKSKYPEIIRLIHHNENVGMMKNFSETLQACSGKYIAFCEGDDYWIDPQKLQKQYDYMESHPHCGLSYTNYKTLYEDTKAIEDNSLAGIQDFNGNCRDIFIGGSRGVMTVTIMILNAALDATYFQFIDDASFKAADFTLFMWVAFSYDIGYLADETAVYRVHKTSVTNTTSYKKKWDFMRSHVYMRKKFLLEKKYNPSNSKQLEINIAREVLTAAARFQVYPQYGIVSYRQIEKSGQVTFGDRLKRLAIHCPQAFRLVKFLNRSRIKMKQALKSN